MKTLVLRFLMLPFVGAGIGAQDVVTPFSTSAEDSRSKAFAHVRSVSLQGNSTGEIHDRFHT